MAVQVYGWVISPFVTQVIMCLEEVGAEYEIVPLDRAAREHKTAAHLARNPFGQVPVLQDGDLMLFESLAISRYVLRKYKPAGPELLRQEKLHESAMVDAWVDVHAHQYRPVIFAIVLQCIFVPVLLGGVCDQKVVDENVAKLKQLLEVYEARLSKSKYLAGDFISLADLSHFPVTHYFMATQYASIFDSYPHVKAWWEDLAARPSTKKVATLMPTDFSAK